MGEITFSSFPRSGNTFTHSLFSQVLPDHKINGILHNVYYLNKKPNPFTTIRNPLECVTSWIVRSDDERNNRAEKILEWYIDFYTTIRSYGVPVIAFLDLVKYPLNVVDYLCDIFGFDKLKIKKYDAIHNETSETDKKKFSEIKLEVVSTFNFEHAMTLFNQIKVCEINTPTRKKKQ